MRTRTLLAEGWTKRQIRDAVATGGLIRLREGAFGHPELDVDARDAARLRGRLTGTSALRRQGVFGLDAGLQVNVPPSAARLRTIERAYTMRRRVLLCTPHPDALVVEALDAVFDAVQEQAPRAAIATIDSALHLGVIRPDELDELFDALPRRLRRLRRLLDARSESGPETLVRLVLRAIGCGFDCQVTIVGVGRVDFLVDGWLIIECDSEAHHATWAAQKEDRRRDLAAATRGLATFRVIAEDIIWNPDRVRAALAALISAPRRSQKQGRARTVPSRTGRVAV